MEGCNTNKMSIICACIKNIIQLLSQVKSFVFVGSTPMETQLFHMEAASAGAWQILGCSY